MQTRVIGAYVVILLIMSVPILAIPMMNVGAQSSNSPDIEIECDEYTIPIDLETNGVQPLIVAIPCTVSNPTNLYEIINFSASQITEELSYVWPNELRIVPNDSIEFALLLAVFPLDVNGNETLLLEVDVSVVTFDGNANTDPLIHSLQFTIDLYEDCASDQGSINPYNLVIESVDLSEQDGLDAAFATRLPNSAGYFATAYEIDPFTQQEATGSPYFLAYDYPNPAGAAADWDYRLYRLDGDTEAGHDFVSVMTIPSAGQYLYFASQYVSDYVAAIPGNEVLVTGYFWYDLVDANGTTDPLDDVPGQDGIDDTISAGIKAVNMNAQIAVDVAMTGMYPSQAITVGNDMFYFYAHPDATDGVGNMDDASVYDATDNVYDLHSVGVDTQVRDGGGNPYLDQDNVTGADGALWQGSVAIQKNNRMVGLGTTLYFMSAGGLVVLDTAAGYDSAAMNPMIQGYIIGFTQTGSLVIGSDTDYHTGGQNPGSLLMMGLDGSVVQANTYGPNGAEAPLGGFFTYGTVLNSYSDYVYFNAIDPVDGSMDVYSYSVNDDDVTGLGFEARTGINIDPTSVNFGAYSGVVGVFRAGLNTNGELIYQLIIMNPDLGINLAFWSDQIDLLSNLAAVLGTGYNEPQFNAGFYTQYWHDLGPGSGKVLTTNIDNAGNLDPGIIDLLAMVMSMQSPDSLCELEGAWQIVPVADWDGVPLADRDGDGVFDGVDQFPDDANEWADTDADGVGDNADAFPKDATETTDSDADGVGDNADAFPDNPAETADTDADGVGDNADTFPRNANETVDSDGDGIGDNADAFPEDANETADSDGDGVGDIADAFPFDPEKSEVSYLGSTMIGTGIGASSTLLCVAIIVFLIRRNRDDDEEYEDEEAEYEAATAQRPQAIQPLSADPLIQQEASIPERHRQGQFADDGYEWIEYPEGSGTWYWRDSQTGDWNRH